VLVVCVRGRARAVDCDLGPVRLEEHNRCVPTIRRVNLVLLFM
jgi:hypothetical protein